MRLPVIFATLCVAATSDQPQAQLAGSWQGYWSRAGDSMAVTLDIKRDTAGRYAATFGTDRLRVSGVPFNEVRVDGCCDISMTLRGDRTTLVFTGKLNGDSFTGTLEETTAVSGRFAYTRSKQADAAGFEEREITFANVAVNLAGTLILPRLGGDALPTVVFVHGSGAEGRWASRFLATKLASQGIAAFIFDKRGVGGSSGDWRTATLEDLAADGAAAVAHIARERRIDPQRVGLHGHSQGGTLAPLVAAKSGAVAFIVGSAAAGTPTDSTEVFSILNSVYPNATSHDDSANANAYVSELVSVAYHQRPRTRLDSLVTAFRGRPWFFAPPAPENSYWSFSPMFAKYHALDWWARVRVPVLLVYGADDQRVPATQSSQRIAATLRTAGNRDVTVQIHPGADHTFRLRPGPGGWPVTAPTYVSDLVEWIAKR